MQALPPGQSDCSNSFRQPRNHYVHLSTQLTTTAHLLLQRIWLVGCFGFNGPLRQYFSLYRAVSQREGERRKRIDESKMSKPPPPAPTASAIGPCPTVIKIVGRPGTGSLPSTIAPPDHPLLQRKRSAQTNGQNLSGSHGS